MELEIRTVRVQSRMLEFAWPNNLIGLNKSTTNVRTGKIISCRPLLINVVRSGCFLQIVLFFTNQRTIRYTNYCNHFLLVPNIDK